MIVLGVNTGRVMPLRIGEREHPSAIAKHPVEGRVRVGRLGLEGDEQADLSVHGGPSKAVYAYPCEHHDFWRTVRAQARVARWDDPLPSGVLGENLAIRGLVESQVWVGDRLRGPDCEFAVSEPRLPCAKFAAAMGFAQAVGLMARSGWCGFYLSVIAGGTVAAGDAFELHAGPREVGIVELFRARVRT